ncbi:D-ribose transporter ATP binding protein [Petrotoga sp. 9T1HF07.CasAA.8.2]|jgi:ribose transport system ATP-binding protein|uniref:sugar ABC transporter ATP-binding protein n=1 Tax=Petrotoga sp. 9T1HF07.CasAA.8.2 TaxID=1434329 RepID=UPI000CC71735|nr:sugar ABC transporter ATP-binding protein [Petrotoga sp. 9T1HF07.CasAA.8.2]PNR88246.1 D-ribose transporter ATP binding protein [Petrotoga sp. 9T1HF07.CasAA.8.2]
MLLEMVDITKTFPGVLALDKVSFNLKEKEIHALLGENGAGKSTLIKILGGIYQPDSGEIILSEEKVTFRSPIEAKKRGISIIHQELMLAENLSIAENIFLGKEKGNFLNIDFKSMAIEAKKYLNMLDFDIDPKIKVSNLNVSEKQLVEIAKAIASQAKIIVMDEPTATITEHETRTLFKVMRDLKEKGISIIFITHKLEEVYQIADRVTVLRDGKLVGSGNLEELNQDDLIKMMVGREIKDMFPKFNKVRDKIALKVEEFEIPGKVYPLSFEVREGEIFGITGLVGCGKSELALGLFGAYKSTFKNLIVENQKVEELKSPSQALKRGIVLVPEDRKTQGLVQLLTVVENITIPNAEEFAPIFNIDWKKAIEETKNQVQKYNIKVSSNKQKVKNLSGGNQQKVVLAKFLLKQPKIAILVEPTRGIDVGAKIEVYKLINDLANRGMGVILVTSEIPEILGLCDRTLIMHRGKKTALLEKEEMTPENILKAGMGLVEIV